MKKFDITINPLTGKKLNEEDPYSKVNTQRLLEHIKKDNDVILKNFLRADELKKFVESDKYQITLDKMKEMGYVFVPENDTRTYSTYDKSYQALRKYLVGQHWTRYEETSDRPRLSSFKAMVDHYSYQMYIDEFYNKYVKND